MPRLIPDITIYVRLKGKRKLHKIEVLKSKLKSIEGIGGRIGLNIKMPNGNGKGGMIINDDGKPTEFRKHQLREVVWNAIKKVVFKL